MKLLGPLIKRKILKQYKGFVFRGQLIFLVTPFALASISLLHVTFVKRLLTGNPLEG